MKKIFAIIVFINYSITGISQDTIPVLTGANGFTFGMTSLQVNKIATQKGGIKNVLDSDENFLSYKFINVGKRTAATSVFKLYKNQLFEINFLFYTQNDSDVQKLYDSIKDDLEKKYGEGKCVRNFSGSYKDGDGVEMQAVKSGMATIGCQWVFKDNNNITIEIMTMLLVRVVYQNDKMITQAIEEQNKVNMDAL